jgi:hypothetical protein
MLVSLEKSRFQDKGPAYRLGLPQLTTSSS